MPSNRKKIISEASAFLFHNKGYNATTMRDIADVVGIEAASLYNHIKSKNDLLQGIIDQVSKLCNEHLAYIKQLENNPAQQIEGIIRFHVKLMLNNFNSYYVMTHDWKHLDEPGLSNFVIQRKNYVQDLENIIQNGINQHVFKDLNPYVIVLNILSAVMGLEFWHKSKKSYTEREIEENMVKHLLSGLLK
jgi:TetR/AcrR family transcriptional regulator, cholesterol catabolism regulator